MCVSFFPFRPAAPSQPLLCKFADSQRKKHAHGGFVPNGQASDLRLVRISPTALYPCDGDRVFRLSDRDMNGLYRGNI